MPDLQQAIRELQETVVVTSGIQSRHAVLLKDPAEWLHAHDLAMTEARERGRELDERIAKDHAEWLQEARERGREIDERIARLVSAIGELVRKQS